MVILLAPLVIMALGLLAYSINVSNYYYSRGHQDGGFWHNWAQQILHPPIIGQIGHAIHNLFAQAVSHWMGQAAAAADAHVGTTFHYLANEIKQMANVVSQVSLFAIAVATYATGNLSRRELNVQLKALRNTVARAEHETRTVANRAIAEEKATAKSVAQGVLPRLRTIEHDIEHVLHPEITATRDLAKSAEKEAARAWKYARSHAAVIGSTAFAGSVAWALSHLGLGWLRCSSNPFNNNKGACGLWSVLSKVLAAAGLLVVAFDFPEFVAGAELVAQGIGDVVASIEGTFEISLPPLPPPQG